MGVISEGVGVIAPQDLPGLGVHGVVNGQTPPKRPFLSDPQSRWLGPHALNNQGEEEIPSPDLSLRARETS